MLTSARLDPKVLDGLVCPECRSDVVFDSSVLKCGSCGREYPVRDGIPCFVDIDPNEPAFKEDYFEFWFRQNKHFWQVGRRETVYQFVEPFLKSRSRDLKALSGIEIGIGNGSVTGELMKGGMKMQGADLFYSSLKYCRKRFDIPLYQADLLKLPFYNKFDFVGIYDIIEHIEDDRKSLKNIYGALKPGGFISITVPACKFLWSTFDEHQHVRRYSKKELVEKVKEAGFKVHRISFMMFLLFPVVYAFRKTQKYPTGDKLENVQEVCVIPVINEIFLAVFRLEKFLLRFFNLPIGSSLILLAEKPQV